MKATLIQGLKEKDMQAMLNQLNLNPFYFDKLFPLKFTPTLTWKSLNAESGTPIMADVVSYNSTAPKKSRQIVERLSGDIPKIAIKREKEESDLNEYFQLLHYANTTEGAQAILDFIYNDVEFCYTGVNARLEYLALQALSTGKVTLNKDNNDGMVLETAVDFLVPDASKKGVSVTWTSAHASTSKPITNLKDLVKAAKRAGNKLGYALMDQDTFDALAVSQETIDFCASWVVKATNLATIPSIESVNRAFSADKNLPQIVIIDQTLQSEIKGVRAYQTPWEPGVVTLIPDLVVGNTYYAPLADELVKDSVATKVKRGHAMIKKYSIEEPVTEVTLGLSNAFPVWASAGKSILIDTTHASWSH
jgi:hypothetical protein